MARGENIRCRADLANDPRFRNVVLDFEYIFQLFAELATGDITGFNDAVDARVDELLTAGTGIDITYDAVADTITVAADFTEVATAAQGALADSAVQPGDIDTLAELNAIITDATLDDSGDPRDPNAHAASHTDGTDDIQDATAAQKGLMTSTYASKLDNIESGATADQTDAEIETAYNNQVSVVSQAEAEAGTSTTVRRWTAQRVKQAIAALETGGATKGLNAIDWTSPSNMDGTSTTMADGDENKFWYVTTDGGLPPGGYTFTLPPLADMTEGECLLFYVEGSDTYTMDANASEVIGEGSDTSKTLNQGEWHLVVADKTQTIWRHAVWTSEPSYPVATQSEMETASATDRVVTPGRQHYHPGHPKAWVAFQGNGTVAIDADYGVTSITDNGTGDYTVNYDTSFSAATYCVMAWACGDGNAQWGFCGTDGTAQAVGSRRITTRDTSSVLADFNQVNVALHGDH